jgi:lysophospholipase L1-like esterase
VRRAPGRTGLAWLVWLGVTSGLSLAGVELGVRLLRLAPPLPNQYQLFVEDPVLPYRLRPESRLAGRAPEGEFEFDYQHNSLGLRERELPFAKPPGTFRILGLGDSFTYGAGAKAENVYLARLERRLNARPGDHPGVEVVNAGVPRYFPEAERLFLQEFGFRYQPDLVLLGFVPNDVIDTYLGRDAIQVLPDGRLVSTQGARLVAQLGTLATAAYTHSHALRVLIARHLRTRADLRPVRPEEVLQPDGFHEAAWREVERQYDLLLELVRARGARLVLVHLPQIGPWDARHDYPAQRLAAWAEARGVAFVDTLPALRARQDSELLYWPKDRHPTDAGHAAIADAIFDALSNQALVP